MQWIGRIGLWLAIVAGCGTHRFYEGAALAQDEVARIKTGAYAMSARNLFIGAVDGIENQTESAEVLPGFRMIRVGAMKPQPFGIISVPADPHEWFDVTLHAQAGHTYKLDWGEGEPRHPVFTDVTND